MRTQKNQSRFIEMFGNGNWEQRPLGDVGTFKRGGGFQKSDYVEHGIPCIHYGQIHTVFGPFIYSHISEISSDLESKTKFASKGDLIIAITSEDAEGSCKSTAWLGAYPVAVGAHAAIYNHCMNPLYMSFFFKSALFNHAKMEYIHGTKVVEIRPDDIAKILAPCPPRSLQEQFSTIAEQADKSKFTDFKSRFIEMFETTVHVYKEVPITALCHTDDDIKCGPFGTQLKQSEYQENGVAVWGIPQINSGFTIAPDTFVTPEKAKKLEQFSLISGDIAMSRKGNVGQCALYPDNFEKGIIASDVVRIRVNKDLIMPQFLVYQLHNSYKVRQQILNVSDGSIMAGINVTKLKKIHVYSTPLERQKQFVSIVKQSDKSKYLS